MAVLTILKRYFVNFLENKRLNSAFNVQNFTNRLPFIIYKYEWIQAIVDV